VQVAGEDVNSFVFGALAHSAHQLGFEMHQDFDLAAPAGLRATMGLDPGLRTGVKVAVVDGTGKLVATAPPRQPPL
jgi:hypothetical protein